ncbi:hypothetical protein SDC9_121389 [bioreactor metagenome]|uniref:Uncharacterized protein n=1 Tax=bioreactor metagenome TaxID=1076179 RepID=A0A645CBU6_9ZZZZ
MKKQLVGRRDLILIGAIALLALALFGVSRLLNAGPAEMVVVTVDSQEYARLPLKEDARLLITAQRGQTNLLVIENSTARISEASCSNQVCVNTGRISEAGEIIVCLPHKVVVSIESE